LKKTFTVTIKNKETGKVYQEQVNSDDYILKEFEKKGFKLAFSCRNGCCTSCAVKIKSGTVFLPMHWGFSQKNMCEVNSLMHEKSCPISKQPELKACSVIIVPN